MEKRDILARLRGHEATLKGLGVSHAALFGSVARGDDRPDSDIDIMVEIAPDARMDVFRYIGIVHMIEDLFPARVDVFEPRRAKAPCSTERRAATQFMPSEKLSFILYTYP